RAPSIQSGVTCRIARNNRANGAAAEQPRNHSIFSRNERLKWNFFLQLWTLRHRCVIGCPNCDAISLLRSPSACASFHPADSVISSQQTKESALLPEPGPVQYGFYN